MGVVAGLVAVGAVGVRLTQSNHQWLVAMSGSDVVTQFGRAVLIATVVLVAGLTLPRAAAKWVAAAAVIAELLLLAPHGFYSPRLDLTAPLPG